MKYSIFCLLFLPLLLSAQQGISGYVKVDQGGEAMAKVSLYQLQLAADSNSYRSTPVASVTPDADGYFTFDNSLVGANNSLYRIQLGNGKTGPLDRTPYRIFIHSALDSLYFERGEESFASYLSSNLADLEWQKLQRTIQRPARSPLRHDLLLKDYVRDSLQILLVKLIGLKELKDKQLLQREIERNPAYYANLLRELEASELPAANYDFLRTNYLLLAHEQLTQKHRLSLVFNGLAVLLLGGLLFYVYRLRRRVASPGPTAKLSRQEQLVRSLIMAGKTNKEIASELFVSVHTVKSHITNLYVKLGVKSRKEVY